MTSEPLTPTMKRGLLALVIFFHVGGVWALTQIQPAKLVVGDVAPLEVSFVAAQPPPQPDPPKEEPPPEPEPPQLESMIQPPLPDLPPPEFPVPPPPPPKPRPLPPKPQQAKPAPTAPTAPAPAAQPAAPKTVSASQVAYLNPPAPIYPARSRRAGEKGTVIVRVLIGPTGQPAQVALQTSSGHPALDESALSAVRAARFRPYSEGGLPQAVWVLVPINFVLQ